MSAMLTANGKRAGLSVGFILTNNFTLTALSTFMDALRLAADDGDGQDRPDREGEDEEHGDFPALGPGVRRGLEPGCIGHVIG